MNVRLCTASLGKMLLIVSLLLQSFALQAQDDDKITMNMRDADIRGVIQWVSDLTGKNILVHNDVQGAVTVISGGPVTKEEAYELFLSSLQLNGFAAIESNTVIKIVPEGMAGQSATPLDAGSSNQIVTRIIPISNLPANQLVALLRPLLPENAKISADATSNSLVVVDRASNITRIQDIIQRMDKPGSGEFDLVKLKHANAADIMESLSQLMPQENGNGGNESAMLSVNFSYDERSNSILMFGDPAKRKNLRSLISRMDQPVTGDGSTQVVYLNYVDAEELVPILAGMAEAHAKNKGEDESKLSATVSASKSTNALIINAPPALLANMKRVVSQVDIRRAQVLVEALVVEVNNEISNEIGVNWVSTNDASSGGAFGAVNTLGDLGLGNISDPSTTFNPANGLTFGFFKNGSLRAALRALASNTKANILSTPTIIALDNEEADLLVGQSVPFRTGESTGSASQTDNPFTTIERHDIGTSLKITPRINRGDSIALQIEQTTENIAPSTPSSDAASDIITNKRSLKTRVLIKDNEVLVIGGLIREDENEVRQKVPLLGDIPLLGKLFSSKAIKKSKTNLMVFIHPVILKDKEHVADLTRKRYNFMRDKQKEISRNNWDKNEYKLKPLLPEFETYAPGGTAPIPSKTDADVVEEKD